MKFDDETSGRMMDVDKLIEVCEGRIAYNQEVVRRLREFKAIAEERQREGKVTINGKELREAFYGDE